MALNFLTSITDPARGIAGAENVMKKASILSEAAGGDKAARGVGLVWSHMVKDTAKFTDVDGRFSKVDWAAVNSVNLVQPVAGMDVTTQTVKATMTGGTTAKSSVKADIPTLKPQGFS